ncbi:MAG: hypothetical protein U9N30_00320, partial [Campylobacterota bacterium]|nr:hypothetical protein [Campylobacterota bacterium]
MPKQNLQKSFFNQITGKEKVSNAQIKVYKDLVYNNFYDLIVNAFPLFYTKVQEHKLKKELKKSIYAFMQTEAKTPFIWKMANEYRKFIKKNRFFTHVHYLNDLLLFEYSELYVFMQKTHCKKQSKYSFKKKYALSKSIFLKQYQYNILNHSYEQAEDLYVLTYFDDELMEVAYLPINQVMYLFLKQIDGTLSLQKNLKAFCAKYGLDYVMHKESFKFA